MIIIIIIIITSWKRQHFINVGGKIRVAIKCMETRNFKAKVLIQKMSTTKLSQIENGDSTPLNHCLAICQLHKL